MADQPNPQSILDQCIDIEELARRWKLSRARIFDFLNDGLPSMKPGRKRVVHWPTAEKWLEGKLAESKPARDDDEVSS